MKEKVVLKQSDGSFLIGLGTDTFFELRNYSRFSELDNYLNDQGQHPVFGCISYQLGYTLCGLEDPFQKELQFPLLRFWTASSVYHLRGEQLLHVSGIDSENERLEALALFETAFSEEPNLQFVPMIDKQTYLEDVKTVREQIQQGNVYELNYCQNFKASVSKHADMRAYFTRLNRENPTPFAAFVETETWSLVSASPERFIRKTGNELLSQPIKGTAPRGKTPEEDALLKTSLKNSVKDRAENVMIVDLVRNDLSRIAEKGSVSVEELFGIYTYPTVHQMISSVHCSIPERLPFSHILKALFPMGSMTGAPKKAAVELAGKLEKFPREMYSGSVGVIYPNGDFDFNVLIRTLAYQTEKQEISCAVGGAITILSDPEAEYEECRTKISKILSLFGTCQW